MNLVELDNVKKAYSLAKKSYTHLHSIMVALGLVSNELRIPKLVDRTIADHLLIIDLVEQKFNCCIKKKTRVRKVMEGRHACAYLLQKYTHLTLKEIAPMVGQNDHTSVIHSKRQCLNWMQTVPGFRMDVEDIERVIEQAVLISKTA